MDLDKMIVQKRITALENHTLDTDENITDMIYEIKAAIEIESQELKDANTLAQYTEEEKGVSMSGREDAVNQALENKTVDLRALLRLDDHEFVIECYRQLLGREPDPAGLADNLYLLRIQEISKSELAYTFCASEEGRKYAANIKGLRRRYRLSRALKKSFRVPLLGRIWRYIYKQFRTNKTIYQMMVWNLNEKKALTELTEQINQSQVQLQNQLSEQIRLLTRLHAQMQTQLKTQQRTQMQLQTQVRMLEVKETGMRSESSALKGQIQQLSEQLRVLDNYQQVVENLQNNNKQLQGHDRILEEYQREEQERLHVYNSYGLLEENIRNNNKLIEKHDTFVENYSREDGKLLQRLAVDWCNTKADMRNADAVPATDAVPAADEALTAETAKRKGTKDEYYSIDYFEFENRFRGSREHIKNVQKIYLPYFENRTQVVDLGCGRGEFVELLREEHIGVEGVDLYQPYVEFCNIMNLPVKQGDAIQYLRQKSGVDGIFAGQIVEHLTIEQIIELCHVAYEKLEPGCYLILETPNPRSLAIYTESFYMDPSHNHPVHPNTLQYIVEKEGFSQVEVLYTDSSRLPYTIPPIADADHEQWKEFDRAMERVSDLLYGSQDYAIIARK